ncbi:hypothetical protein CAEBREN_19701 [Caenorhabditis brenneri]|uniref:F-box domain-containing protein n=1 Tax=Caenorhabditis brenneri TaxID=135651 RepID=G0NLW9_CAEBE|nr:hypothetical protein CAEBREN_19701 [Caenorhabditis brenneri]
MELCKKLPKFPLLFLPIIVIENALRNLNPIELIKFSQISKRCLKMIKYSTRKNPFKIIVTFSHSPQIRIKSGHDFYNMARPFFPEDFDVNLDKYGCVRILWSANWIEYILDALNCKINDFSIRSEECLYSFPFIIDWFSTMKHCLEFAAFEGQAIISEHLKLFLEACKTTRGLVLSLYQSYEILPVDINSLKMDYIGLSGRTQSLNWITLNTIMSFDCIDLKLGEFVFAETEMNLFLKDFLKGRILPRMKNFWIELLPMNFQLLTDGIEANQREKTVVREYVHKYPMLSITFRGRTDVHKESGELVTFEQSPPPSPFDPNCKARFRMVVW